MRCKERGEVMYHNESHDYTVNYFGIFKTLGIY